MTATDRDSGVNGELVYKVSDDHFTIETKYIDNQYVGHIKVAKYVFMELLFKYLYLNFLYFNSISIPSGIYEWS